MPDKMDDHSPLETDSLNPLLQDFEILTPVKCSRYEWSINRLASNLKSMIHSLLIAPRGYGIQQIVSSVITEILNEDPFVRICHLELAGIQSREDFIRAFEESTIELPLGYVPTATTSNCGIYDMLYLPEFKAIRHRVKLIFIMGNLQTLLRFDQDFNLLKTMSTIWKENKHCVFLMYGNQEQLESDVTDIQSRILFGFVKIIKLPRPDVESMISGIKEQFRVRGKNIGELAVRRAISYCDQNPYYTRLLTWHAFQLTTKECTSREVDLALCQCIEHHRIFYIQIVENLTLLQLRFLKAYLNEWSNLCSREDLRKYGLRSSSQVARIKKSLYKKEIIYLLHGEIYLKDPLFCYWLKSDYFR